MFFLPRFQAICVKTIIVHKFGELLSPGSGHVCPLLGDFCLYDWGMLVRFWEVIAPARPRIQHQTKCKKTCSSIAWRICGSGKMYSRMAWRLGEDAKNTYGSIAWHTYGIEITRVWTAGKHDGNVEAHQNSIMYSDVAWHMCGKKNVQCVPWRTCGGPVKYTSSSVAWRVCESQKCTAP